MSVDVVLEQLTLEEKAVLTSGCFAGKSLSHDTIETLAAAWPERHGGTA